MTQNSRAGSSGPLTSKGTRAQMPLAIPPLAPGGSGYYALTAPGIGSPQGVFVSAWRDSSLLPIQVFAKPNPPTPDAVSLHITNPGPDPVDLSGFEFWVMGSGYP